MEEHKHARGIKCIHKFLQAHHIHITVTEAQRRKGKLVRKHIVVYL